MCSNDSQANGWIISLYMDSLQPESLPDFDSGRSASTRTLLALRELGLVEEKKGKYRFRKPEKSKLTTREMVLDALDAKVLSKTDIEPYFAPFYCYLLGLNNRGCGF